MVRWSDRAVISAYRFVPDRMQTAAISAYRFVPDRVQGVRAISAYRFVPDGVRRRVRSTILFICRCVLGTVRWSVRAAVSAYRFVPDRMQTAAIPASRFIPNRVQGVRAISAHRFVPDGVRRRVRSTILFVYRCVLGTVRWSLRAAVSAYRFVPDRVQTAAISAYR